MWKTVSKGAAAVEPAVKQYLPPCQEQCPINEDIQRTNVLISLLPEDPSAAAPAILDIGDYLYHKNPFFPVCGYVCGLCELECNYHAKGRGNSSRRLSEAVRFGHLHSYHLERKAAIGPGISANTGKRWRSCRWRPRRPDVCMGFDLSKRGYQVTIFEASERLGWCSVVDSALPAAGTGAFGQCGQGSGSHCGHGHRGAVRSTGRGARKSDPGQTSTRTDFKRHLRSGGNAYTENSDLSAWDPSFPRTGPFRCHVWPHLSI